MASQIIKSSLILNSMRSGFNSTGPISYKPAAVCFAYNPATYSSRLNSTDTKSSSPAKPDHVVKVESTPDTITDTPSIEPTTVSETASTIAKPSQSNLDIKWDFDGNQLMSPKLDLLTKFQMPEIAGSIIPFSELNIAQKIFFPYQYPIMHYMDFLVTHLASPWWLTIVATTATIKLLSFPLVVKQNIIGIKVNNIMPETQKIQVKINEATMAGDAYGAAVAKTKLKILYDEHQIKVSQRLLPILIQTPAFLCLFFTLKNLAGYYKIPAMAIGGALWFSDLTVADPTYLMPILTSASMFLLMEFGLEGGNKAALLGPTGRWLLRLLPVGLLFIFKNFPTAVLLFWITNNLFTLTFALFLRGKFAKRIFKIPISKVHDPKSLPLTNQTFSGQLESAKEKARASRTVHDLRKLDDIAFQKAGIGPLRKTYKEPPKKLD